jgi:hypothetical protein
MDDFVDLLFDAMEADLPGFLGCRLVFQKLTVLVRSGNPVTITAQSPVGIMDAEGSLLPLRFMDFESTGHCTIGVGAAEFTVQHDKISEFYRLMQTSRFRWYADIEIPDLMTVRLERIDNTIEIHFPEERPRIDVIGGRLFDKQLAWIRVSRSEAVFITTKGMEYRHEFQDS